MTKVLNFLCVFLLAGISVSTAEKLEITQATPTGDITDQDQTNAIQIVFNQPMVALEQLPQGSGSGPLTIVPAVAGKYRWKGTEIIVFIPDAPLQLATEYTVTVPQGTSSAVTKEQLSRAYQFMFRTSTPHLINVAPGYFRTEGNADNVSLNRTIYLQFDQPVDIANLKNLISVEPSFAYELYTPLDTNSLNVYGPRIEQQRAQYGTKRVDVIAIKPKQKFSMASQYKIRIKPGVKSLIGGSILSSKEDVYTFTTIKPLIFNGVTWCEKEATLESLSDVNPHGYLRAEFNNSIDLPQFVKYTRSTPALPFPPAFSTSDWTTSSIDLNQGFAPNTAYEVTFDANLTDIYGSKLGKNVTYRFKTGNYKPYLKALTGHGVVEFSGKRRIPLEVVNFQKVDVQFWQLNGDVIVPLLNNNRLFSRDSSHPGKYSKQLSVPFNTIENQRQRVPVYLDSALGGLPGLVLVQTIDRVTETNPQFYKSLIQVTNLGITAKFGYDNTVIVATAINTAEPVKGAAVEIRSSNNTIVWTGKTDADGKAIAPSWASLGLKRADWGPPKQFVFVRLGQDIAFISSDWESGISPWRFNIDYASYQTPRAVYKGTIISDRDIYRPGETAFLKGFVRYLENGSWQPAKHSKVAVTISATSYYSDGSEDYEESDGESSEDEQMIIFQDTLPLAKIGSFEFKAKIPEKTRLGSYTIGAQVVGFEQDIADKKFSQEISGSFRIAEFRPVEMEVKVVPEQNSYFYGDEIKTTVSANYLFGAPVKKEQVQVAIRRTPYRFNPQGFEDFSFTDYSSDDDDNENRQESTNSIFDSSAILDDKGILHLNYKAKRPAKASPASYLIEATVSGKSKQPVSSWASVALHPAPVYIGIRTSDYFGTEKKPLTIETVALSTKGKRSAGQTITVFATRRYWVSVRKSELDGRLSWDTQRRDTVCMTQTIKSNDASASAITFLPQQAGYYIFTARITDNKDTIAKASTTAYVCGGEYASWKRSDDDYLEVIPERKRYEPGQTARILIKSPYKTAKALLTVEREGVISTKWITLNGSAATIDLPIEKSFLPNVFVSIMIIKGRNSSLSFDDDGNDLSKPAFKIGYCELAVEPAGKRLKVAVQPAQEEYQPGDSVSVTVRIPNLAGKTYASDALVMAVDEGVLLLTKYKTPDPFSFFYGPRPLCVLTGELLASVIGERNYGEKGQNRGGGGGIDPSLFAQINSRSNFKICAYFNPRVVFDKEGSATVRFKLPDNLSTFRIMVVAQSAMGEFGSGDARITVNKKLMLRPFMPRFLRMGDSCSAGVVAENYSGSSDTLSLNAEVSNARILSGNQKRTVINKGSNAFVLMPIIAGTASDSITYSFKGILGKNTDGVSGTIPLVYERAMETVALSGSTLDSARQLLRIPDSSIKEFSSLKTSMASTAMIGLGESVRYLYEYPYGCLEQRTSRVLPLILFEEMARAFGMKGLAHDDAAAVIREYLSQVSTYQCENGGFDYWTSARYDSPYLSAYVTIALLQAEKKGYTVDRKSKEKALAYCAGFLNGKFSRNYYPYGNPEWASIEATIIAVLAEAGDYRADAVERLYKTSSTMPIFGLAQLYKAVSIGNGDAQIREDLKRKINNCAKIEAATVHFEEPASARLPWLHSTNVLTTSVILLCMLQADEEYPQAEKAVRWIMQQQRSNRWNSTHENLYAFWALAAYFDAYERETPDFKASAMLDGRIWMEAQFSGRSSKQKVATQPLSGFEPGKKVPLNFTKIGAGRLYYQARMSYAPIKGISERNEGIAVRREYKSLTGKTIEPTDFKIDQPVVVTVTVETKSDRLFVAVNDPIPAGCEIIDPTLSVVAPGLAAKITQINNSGREYWWGSWNHTEYRDQRCLLFANYLNKGVHTYSYLLRPTTEGRFYTPPANAEEMYAPEIFGRTGECLVTIKK